LTLSADARIVQDIHCERLRPAGDIRAGRFHYPAFITWLFVSAFHPMRFMSRFCFPAGDFLPSPAGTGRSGDQPPIET
jgi:hypothetical protein